MSRVLPALGASVVLHVLGALALWRGASEPERARPDRPLEVELVWREAAGHAGALGTGSAPEVPAPVRAPERVSRPIPGERSHGKVTGTSRVGEQAATSRVARAEPPVETRVEAPAPGEPPAPAVAGLPEAPAPVAPRGAEAGAPGSGVAEASAVGAPGGAPSGAGAAGGGLSAGGAPGAGSGVDSELRAYRERLSRHVTRQRRYPAQAARLGMEGTALVWVRINQDGSLAAPPRLEGSSRFRVLDAEALRMVEAAAPFSPLPAELSRESAEFVIPVSFSLRAIAG